MKRKEMGYVANYRKKAVTGNQFSPTFWTAFGVRS